MFYLLKASNPDYAPYRFTIYCKIRVLPFQAFCFSFKGCQCLLAPPISFVTFRIKSSSYEGKVKVQNQNEKGFKNK